MADYGTLAELKRYAYMSKDTDDDVLSACLTRASRTFDRYTGHKPDYFAAGSSGQTASAREFWGDGTDYLQIDPYLATPALVVAMPSAYDVPPYLESRSLPQTDDGQGFYLIRTYGDDHSRFAALRDGRFDSFAIDLNYNGPVGWPNGICVTITGKWGWPAVPEDVKEAVLETAVAIFRGKDQAFARVVNLETSTTISDALPPRAKLIADRYRMGRGMFA